MKPGNSRAASVGIIIVLAACLFSSLRTLHNAVHVAPWKEDPVSMSDQRFREARGALPKHGRIGYIGDMQAGKPGKPNVLDGRSVMNAFREFRRTGDPAAEALLNSKEVTEALLIERRRLNRFYLAQYSLCPLLLVTKMFNHIDRIYMQEVDLGGEMEEYPDWVLGDHRGGNRCREDPEWAGYAVVGDYENGVVVLKRKSR